MQGVVGRGAWVRKLVHFGQANEDGLDEGGNVDGSRTLRCVVASIAVAVLGQDAACTDSDDERADAVICEAIGSVDSGANAQDAAAAVERIKATREPESDVLSSVRARVFAEGNQLALPVLVDDLTAACEATGVDLDLPSEDALAADLCALVVQVGDQRRADSPTRQRSRRSSPRCRRASSRTPLSSTTRTAGRC